MLNRPALALEPFGIFSRTGAPPVTLFEGYRDLVKRRWRGSSWPVATLLALDDDAVALPEELALAVARIRSSRTLPIRAEEIAALLGGFSAIHPE
jgi:hypothetical protein